MTAQLHLDGREQSERVCRCGCGRSLEGMRKDAIYASSSCRALIYRRDRGIVGYRPVKAVLNGKPSGLQVSFWKAQGALQEWLEQYVPDARAPRNLSVSILTDALSERQREQLHERKRAKRAPALTVAEQREAYERQAA